MGETIFIFGSDVKEKNATLGAGGMTGKARGALGLPSLTFAEASRLLGTDEGLLMGWVMQRFRPGPGRWSEWTRGVRPLPEHVIRLYLMERASIAERLPALAQPKPRGALRRGRRGGAA